MARIETAGVLIDRMSVLPDFERPSHGLSPVGFEIRPIDIDDGAAGLLEKGVSEGSRGPWNGDRSDMRRDDLPEFHGPGGAFGNEPRASFPDVEDGLIADAGVSGDGEFVSVLDGAAERTMNVVCAEGVEQGVRREQGLCCRFSEGHVGLQV